MKHEPITNQRDLTRFCETISGAATIAFDTEFVSEDRYRPELCLAQVAVAGRLAVIDPLEVGDLAPFWELIASPPHTTIVHSGRQELCFCLSAIGKRPYRLFDTQIAAGLIGLEYPAAYSTLVARLVGKTLHKGETRSNWRRRPLSHHQVRYALQDVAYLEPLRDALVERLQELGRLPWLEAELDAWQTQIEHAEFADGWQRIPGTANLPPSAQAIVRALWRWREGEAQRQNRPPRRVLRDDLLVELARRGSADVDQIRAVRGMERRDRGPQLGAIAACIREALDLPSDEWPRSPQRLPHRPLFALLGQFLATALGSVCRERQLAPGLLGSVQDIRDYVHYRLSAGDGDGRDPPAMAQGWRFEIAGPILDELLAGNTAVRVADPWNDQPLRFERNLGLNSGRVLPQ